MRRLAQMRGARDSAGTALAMSKLDARFRPGVSPSEFYETFTQCACELIMTRPSFPHHHCSHTVVELTDDSSDGVPDHTSASHQ